MTFYVQKHTSLCTVVITSLLDSDKPLWAPAPVKRVYWTSEIRILATEALGCNKTRILVTSRDADNRLSAIGNARISWKPSCHPSTHWGRVTHICVSKLTIIGSDNGLSPGRRQAIIWTNAGILLIWTFRNKLQWNFKRYSDIFVEENAFENVIWKMAAILSRPQCVNLFWLQYIGNLLRYYKK